MFKKVLVSLGIVSALAGFVTVAVPVPAFAQGTCQSEFMGFPAWHKGLDYDADCSIKMNNPKLTDFWIIAFNIVGIILRALVYFAVGYVLWGGFKYIKSQGEPGKLQQAKNTILYALIGLAVALASVMIVDFVQGLFT